MTRNYMTLRNFFLKDILPYYAFSIFVRLISNLSFSCTFQNTTNLLSSILLKNTQGY